MNCYQIFSLSIYIFRTNKLPLARVIAVIAIRHLAACSGNQGTEVGEFSERLLSFCHIIRNVHIIHHLLPEFLLHSENTPHDRRHRCVTSK